MMAYNEGPGWFAVFKEKREEQVQSSLPSLSWRELGARTLELKQVTAQPWILWGGNVKSVVLKQWIVTTLCWGGYGHK